MKKNARFLCYFNIWGYPLITSHHSSHSDTAVEIQRRPLHKSGKKIKTLRHHFMSRFSRFEQAGTLKEKICSPFKTLKKHIWNIGVRFLKSKTNKSCKITWTHTHFWFCLSSRTELRRCRYKLAWDRRKGEWRMTSGGGISIWLSTLTSMAFLDKHTSKRGSKFSPRLSSSNARFASSR